MLTTLSVDIGGTGLKASVLDATGQMEHGRVRTPTPYPLSPERLVTELQGLIAQLPPFDRISVGFPGMVRGGHILSAPHFVSAQGPGGSPTPKLVKAWSSFDLETALQTATGKPTKVANDADIQGAAVVKGKGFEAVITLGTGVGTAFFLEGQLLPHFEFAHHPLRKGGTYNDALGDATRKRIGQKKWQKRVLEALETMRALTFFDVCYLGGGNSVRVGGVLPAGIVVVDNDAGILGGIKLWERTQPPSTTATTAVTTRSGPRATTAKAATPRATGVKAVPKASAPATKTTAPGAKTVAPGTTPG